MLFFMKSSNKKRESRNVDAELAGLDQKAQADLDYKHPSFRWRP
jgi:hypothetical protein